MEIYYRNIPLVLVFLTVFCFWLDGYIWRVNIRWAKDHPDQPRHPYSPRFTAMGVTGVVAIALPFLIPWGYAAIAYALFIVYGGLMWWLHHRRWEIRVRMNQSESQ